MEDADKDREFKCLVLKTLRALIRSVWLFDRRSCKGWDWKTEMGSIETELNRVVAGLKDEST